MSLLGSALSIGGMIVGGVIGFYLGGPGGASLGASIGGAIGGIAGGQLFPDRPDLARIPPPQPHENRIQISSYGAARGLMFGTVRSAKDYAGAKPTDLEEDIRPTGFYRNKAKSIQKCCQELIARFGGEVPKALDELVTLPGVGRKTANVVLGNAFGIPGIVVDTPVQRLSQRIGLTKNEDPVKIEFDLMEIVPKEEWTHFSNLLVWHGRRTCIARKPLCPTCVIRKLCEYRSKTLKG